MPLYSLDKDATVRPQAKPRRGTPELTALEAFAQEVKLVLHTTVNPSETPAVLQDMTAPELPDLPAFSGPVKLLKATNPTVIILGMYGGYKSALVQTEQGEKCKKEIEDALKHLPNVQLLIAVGVAYSSTKFKFGDVLVSKHIRGAVNPKFKENKIEIRSSEYDTIPVKDYLSTVFARNLHEWNDFKCTTEGRISKVYAGDMVCVSWLLSDESTRNKLLQNFPDAVGGEMEGHELVKIQKANKEKQPPHDLGIIIIKGAADYGDKDKQSGKKWQFTAARAASSYTKYRLEGTSGELFGELISLLALI